MNHLKQTAAYLSAQLLALTIALLPISFSVASETFDPPQAVRFACTTVKPWGIKSAGINQGLLVSVINALEQETGIPIINELQPYPRVVHSLHSGHVDLAFLFDSPLSKKEAIRIGHLMDTRMIIVGPTGAQSLTSLDELAGKRVGLIRGAKYGAKFDDASHFQRVSVSTMEQGLAMLLRDRIDVMVGSDQSLFWAMRKMNVGARRLSKIFVLHGTSGSLYMSKHSARQDLIPTYQKALQKLHDEGVINSIFDSKYEWGNSESVPK